MTLDVKHPHENYLEGITASAGTAVNKYTDDKIQEIISNTTKTLRKFMMIRQIALERLNELVKETKAGVKCG